MPSEAVQLALIAIVSSLVTGGLLVVVAMWANTRQKRTEAQVKRDDKDQDELSNVRREYLEEIRTLRLEIKALRDRLDTKDREIDTLQDENRTLRADVRDLKGRLAQYEKERT